MLIDLLLEMFLKVFGGTSNNISLQLDNGLVCRLVVLNELGDLGLLLLDFDEEEPAFLEGRTEFLLRDSHFSLF